MITCGNLLWKYTYFQLFQHTFEQMWQSRFLKSTHCIMDNLLKIRELFYLHFPFFKIYRKFSSFSTEFSTS